MKATREVCKQKWTYELHVVFSSEATFKFFAAGEFGATVVGRKAADAIQVRRATHVCVCHADMLLVALCARGAGGMHVLRPFVLIVDDAVACLLAASLCAVE